MKKVDTVEFSAIGEAISIHIYTLELDEDLRAVRNALEALYGVSGEDVTFVPVLQAKVTVRAKMPIVTCSCKPKPDDYMDTPRKKKK